MFAVLCFCFLVWLNCFVCRVSSVGADFHSCFAMFLSALASYCLCLFVVLGVGSCGSNLCSHLGFPFTCSASGLCLDTHDPKSLVRSPLLFVLFCVLH